MYGNIVCTAMFVLLSFSYAIATTLTVTIYPTPLVYTHKGLYCQRIMIQADQEFEGQIIASIDGVVTKKNVTNKVKESTIDCYRKTITQPSRLDVTIKNKNTIIIKKTLTIPPVKMWKIYCVPFTHVDIGFTQSQKNVRAQNISNLQKELLLLEQTKHYPARARFKLFTEVSWPVIEFLNSSAISKQEKSKLVAALQKKDFELGAFVISHQNRFMSPYALFASLHHTLRIAQQYSINVKTACIHDVMDFSKITKVLQANNIPYCLVGPNDSRYRVPPLFYLVSPDGSAKVMVWHTACLNGYGENFDLNMRLSLPFKDEEFISMENSIAYHLAQLEKGYPTEEIQRYYDYNHKHWEYPYDAYLLPYYPAEGGDNQPQNKVPSEIAKTWNTRFVNPEIIIATPQEFFDYIEQRYANNIPVLKGEMPPFWGEQIYLDFIQVDPQRLSINSRYDTAIFSLGKTYSDAVLNNHTDNIETYIAKNLEGYMAIILNNDHNPRPVPFGKTHYTKQDVNDWMNTRNQWVYTPMNIIKDFKLLQANKEDKQWTKISYDAEKPIIIENQFYRIAFDTGKGCITSIHDKQLQKEWVNKNHTYGFNQYVIGVRGENAARRNYFETIAGFKKVTTSLFTNGNDYRIVIEGSEHSYYKGMELLSEFLHNAFEVKLPPVLLKIAYFFYQLFTPSLSVTQEIIIPGSEKRIDFIQRFAGSAPQIAEHYFAYPVNSREMLYDSACTVLRWGGVDTGGNLILAAKNIAPFRSINDTLYPFQWMHGLPSSVYFDSFVLHKEGLQYAVFVSQDSKAIVPVKDDMAGFYHCCIGWTLWGKLGLGRDLPGTIAFKSTFTSFTAQTHNEAIATAYRFSFDESDFVQPPFIQTNNAHIAILYNQPISQNKIVIGMYEILGKKQKAICTITTKRKIQRAYCSDVSGKKIKPVAMKNNAIETTMNPYELLFITLELL
ncbi:MAG: hypothetical protein AB1444_05500 [Spirochaetota bacterium]